MNRKEELEQQLSVIQNELYEISEAERLKKAAALVGRCFKYHNSYSGDTGCWCIYRVVYKKKNKVRYLDAQTTRDGKVRLEDFAVDEIDFYNWHPITKKQYKAGLNRVLKHIKNLTDAATK